MTKEPLTVGQVEDIFRRMLPDFLKDDEVQRIAEQVFERKRDRTPFAPASHSHALADIEGAQGLTAGLAREGHTHDVSEVTGLDDRIAAAVSAVQVPTDYAPKGHRHTADDIDLIPPTKVAGLDKLLFQVKSLESLHGHDHPELRAAIKRVEDAVAAIPAPVPFDPADLWGAIKDVNARIDALPAPKSPTVDVHIAPVPAPSVTCAAEYVVLATEPSEPHVRDAEGTPGTVRVTQSGDKYLVRAVFKNAPALPLTYSFNPHVSPPVLCSIGSSLAAVTS